MSRSRDVSLGSMSVLMRSKEITRKDVRVIFIPASDLTGLVNLPVASYTVTRAELTPGNVEDGVLITLEGSITGTGGSMLPGAFP